MSFWVNWHYIDQYLPWQGHILDNRAGPGKYSILIAKKGLKVTLMDLTPRLVEIAESKADEHGVCERFEGSIWQTFVIYRFSTTKRLMRLPNREYFCSSNPRHPHCLHTIGPYVIYDDLRMPDASLGMPYAWRLGEMSVALQNNV